MATPLCLYSSGVLPFVADESFFIARHLSARSPPYSIPLSPRPSFFGRNLHLRSVIASRTVASNTGYPRQRGGSRVGGFRWRRSQARGVQVRAGAAVLEKEGGLAESKFVQYLEEDFDIAPSVSIGLAGRADEELYEATVQNPNSPLRGMRVVLRKLTGPRAVRWGKRALEVSPRLARNEDQHNPYMARVHGYIPSDDTNQSPVLVHAYYGSYSLHHWLMCPNWVTSLEQRLALDKEAVRRVGDVRTGGPPVSRQLRLVQMLLRDVLIGVNYVHSRGMAHTDLRLQNVLVSAADRRLKVGIPGNAVDLPAVQDMDEEDMRTRKNMIAFDIKCVGMIMARLVLRELMEPRQLAYFKTFLQQGHHPAGLREHLLPLLCKDSVDGSVGLQILDRGGGAGWNLLAAMLAQKPGERISAVEALRHPFLCGPRWKVEHSWHMARWVLGSMATRITEEFIYMKPQKERLLQLLSLLEAMNPSRRAQDFVRLAPGQWRLLYHTGRQIGLTRRLGSPPVRLGHLSVVFDHLGPVGYPRMSLQVGVAFTAMPEKGPWPHDKSGVAGHLVCKSDPVYIGVPEGSRIPAVQKALEAEKRMEEPPSGLPLTVGPLEMSLELDLKENVAGFAQKALREVRLQIPKEMFDLGLLRRVTYLDSRLLILRGNSGAALFFARSPACGAAPDAL